MKKKIISICMPCILGMVLLGGGCVSFREKMDLIKQGGHYGDSDYAEKNLEEEELITVGFSQIGSESDWRMACTQSVQEAFSAENGFNLIYHDAQQKQENEIKAIREFIDQGVDYIILDPITEKGWDSALKEAKEAGIPVIIFDRDVDVSDENLYTAWIGSDFLLEGRKTCAWLKKYLDQISYEGNLNIVHIQGTEDATAQIGRSEALEEAVKTYKNWNLLDQESGEFTTAKGKEIMEEMLENYGSSIQLVYCENDNMAYGAIEALEEHGIQIGSGLSRGEVMVLSFDATKRGLQLALNGKIAMDTECSPLYGPKLLAMIQALKAGEEIEKRTCVEENQFSIFNQVGSINVDGITYGISNISPELIEERSY